MPMPATKVDVQVRLQTFEDAMNDKPILELPVVFTGSFGAARAYCEKQEGYVAKNSRNSLFGRYYYNKEKCLVLLLT